jgi:pimeloyl-ACP methyl ester carboxylesterase
MDSIEIRDLNVCYELSGDGHPVVLIQGLTANMDWWDPALLNALSERYRVLTFDNRGAGRTVTPQDGEWTCEMFADDTAALMDAVGIDRAYVLGASMGGMIAQELIIKYPQKVSKLVLCSTFCGGKNTVYPTQEVLLKMADSSGGREGVLQRTVELMFTPETIAGEPEVIEGFKAAWIKAPTSAHNAARQYIAASTIDLCDRLGEITVSALVATGTGDILIPPENSRIIAGRIPGVKHLEYEGFGHSFISRMPREFINELLVFLGS